MRISISKRKNNIVMIYRLTMKKYGKINKKIEKKTRKKINKNTWKKHKK